MRYVWDTDAWSDHLYWQVQDHPVRKRINELIKDAGGVPIVRRRILVGPVRIDTLVRDEEGSAS